MDKYVEKDKVCKRWEPDISSPFISLIKSLGSSSSFDNNLTDSLDASDFRLAPNWITFCLDYLGAEPFPRQLQEAMFLFGDFCPNKKCTNHKYLDLYDQSMGNILDNITFLEYGKCPKCGKNRLELIEDFNGVFPGYPVYDEFTGVVGQRGGKTALFGLLASYMWHRYAKIDGSPAEFFGLPRSTKLHMSFLALTFQQAKDTLWDFFSGYINDSWWFKDYHKFLDDQCKALGINPVLKYKETFIWYKHKNIQASPIGPDSRIIRGPTRFGYGIDELGWFSGGPKSVKLNPDEIYNPLNNSLKTIRVAAKLLVKRTGDYHVPTAYAVNISSPSTARDKIMRLLYTSRKISSMRACHYPTWEFNPRLTREDFDDEFAKDPKGARKNFGAFPPLTDNPFISSPRPLLENVRPSKKNCFGYSIIEVMNKRKSRFIAASMNHIRNPKKPVLIGIDAGFSKNAFAVTALSYDIDQDIATLEGAIEIKPVDNKPVHFPYMYKNVLVPILDNLNVAWVFLDRWQSIDIQQMVETDYPTACSRYSLTYSDFEGIRSSLLGDKVLFPKLEIAKWQEIIEGIQDYEDFFLYKPIAHLLLQIVTVQDSGRRIEKGGSDIDDDLFRALSLCLAFTTDEEVQDKLRLLDSSEVQPEAFITSGQNLTIGVSRHYSRNSGRKLSSGRGTGIGCLRTYSK